MHHPIDLAFVDAVDEFSTIAVPCACACGSNMMAMMEEPLQDIVEALNINNYI